MSSTVVILDFGSQYTQLIARKVRELGVYCEIYPFHISSTVIAQKGTKAIILSGSPASVHDKKAPFPDKKIFSMNVPVLGICYGMHVITNHFKGTIESSSQREFGRAVIQVKEPSTLLSSCDKSEVWMSHGDKVHSIPQAFHISSVSESGICGSIENDELKIYGLQFHPEVFHSTKGKDVFSNFLFKICHLQKNWSPKVFIESISEKITTSIKNEKAICAISGGVDSAVSAALVSKTIHSNLRCVFVDNGLLRKNEVEQVSDALQTLNLNLTVVKASSTFLTRLKGITDPEKKRKIIGKTFIDTFESKIKSEKFLVQGTLYPDVIESINVLGPSQVIKSHHNVGGIPKRMKLKLFEPLRELFKDEVREVGKTLGLPNEILERHPFPGPGLAVRIIGEVTKSKLSLLREVDDIFISELRHASLYHQVWQAFAVLLSTKSVGVMGDNRSYENVVVLRAVNSVDGMTADWSKLPLDFLASVSTKIVNRIQGVNRVAYDISSKPPATIEWE